MVALMVERWAELKVESRGFVLAWLPVDEWAAAMDDVKDMIWAAHWVVWLVELMAALMTEKWAGN